MSKCCGIHDRRPAKWIAKSPATTTLRAVKIGVLQLNSTIGDYAANQARLLAGYETACGLGAELVMAPEMFLCGYPPRDLLLRPVFVDANLATLADTARRIGSVPLCVGFVDRNET